MYQPAPSGFHATDWIAQHAMATPAKLAVIDHASDRRHSYAAFDDRIGRLAGHLAGLGVGPGDRVGYLGFNSTDILEIIFACWRVGAVALALNYRLTASELSYILGDATPRVVFYDATLSDLWQETARLSPTPHAILFDGLGGDTGYEAAIAAAAPFGPMIAQDLNAQCMLMYSSGTTGRPKGVIITHAMLHFSATAGLAVGRTTRDCTSLAAMPLFHIAGVNVSCFPMLYAGGTVVVQRMFDPDTLLDALDDPDLGITHLFLVPAAYNALRSSPKAETTDYSRIITALSGAETVPVPLVRWWNDHGVHLQEGWGMTETSGAGCALADEDIERKPGSAGKPLMGISMRIKRSDGALAGPDEPGEIQIRGAVVTPGYWNRPEADAAAFDDGWLRTGDIGRRDAEGYFYIEDRAKDMYISGGENIYPAEVENHLYELAAIREVAVIGVPDPTWGEVGCAVVALHDGAALTLEQITASLDGTLARFKWPRHMVAVAQLPRSATGKVLKFELRACIPARLSL